MFVSVEELARAREVVSELLEELRLDAYLFEVEPRADELEVRVECAIADGWASYRLIAAKEQLLRGVDDATVRQRLLDDWRETLSDCVRAL